MCFFRSILLIFMIIVFSFMIYQYISEKKNISINKKTIILIFLSLIQILFIIFREDLLFVIFLDFPCFLGYMLKRRKEAILLCIVNMVYYMVVLEIPYYFCLIYLGYLGLDYLTMNRRKNSIKYFISGKAFITSFIYFLYFEHSVEGIFYLILIFLYFYILLELTYCFLRNYEERKNDDTMIFQIAHEVKNPIAVCKGYLDMLDTTKQEKVNKYIPIIRSEMNRALTIMDDFLSLKRLAIHKDIMDLSMLIEDIEGTMESILSNKNIILETPKIEEEELLIEGDYDRLKQVLVNLIKNAYEANAKKIKIELYTKRDRIEIKIVDDGDGINAKDLKKIGQIFYTTKVKGTGIGINMSREIIKLHQGNIKYHSLVGEGTTVTIDLPSQFLF